MTELHVLNLGAGVQSTALYLMFARGEITPQVSAAVFADTGEEPGAEARRLGLPDPPGSVPAHLDWLVSLGGPPILNRAKTDGRRLGDDLKEGTNSTGQRFAAIPAFTKGDDDTDEGRTKRQCSKEYKVEVIERTIRRELLHLQPGQRINKATIIHQYIGISLDEAGRARRLLKRKQNKTWKYHFPLIESFMTRADCERYLADKVPHQTPRSACVFCPYHDDHEWDRLRREDPAGWRRALEIDQGMRTEGWVGNRQMNRPMYLHRSCQPIDLVQLDLRPKFKDQQQAMSFWAECEGVCGN